MKDYYRILNVDRQASAEEIKKAYRRLAKQCHPDVVKDNRENRNRMYEIQEAYACLENEEQRRKYDEEYLKSFRNAMDIGERMQRGREPFEEKKPDMGRFERFFGFCPGKGMETYRRQEAGKK